MHKNIEDRKRCQAAWYLNNHDAVLARKRASYLTRRALHLAWEARRRASRKGISYTLEPADVDKIQAVIDLGLCEITGSRFDLETARAWNSPSLDQIRPGAGYVAGNVRVVCRAMNFAMGEWGDEPVWQMFQNWRDQRSAGTRG